MLESIPVFLAASVLLTITPGVDTALVVRTAIAGGRRAALTAGAGICTGLFVWGSATALGLSALLAASRAAYDVLRLVGAVYLVVLGIRTLLASRTERHDVDERPRPAGRRTFLTGLLTNILNPKVGVFYVAFLPQFVRDGASVLPATLVLVAVHAVEGLLWFALVATVATRMTAAVDRPAVRRRLEQLTGVVFVGFGLRLALDRR